MKDNKNKLSNPDLEGEIYYFTEIEGGKSNSIKSGYRGQFYYEERDWDAIQEFLDKEICNPGEIVKVRLYTLSPEFHVGKFYIGKEFEIREGIKTVGKGKITRILTKNFNYWDFESFFKTIPTECKPFNSDNIENFITDFKYYMNINEQVDYLKITKLLFNNNQILTIECGVNNRARLLVVEIIKFLEEKFKFTNFHYKINSKYNENRFGFELSFATQSNMYLIGKIIVNTI